MNTNAYKKTQNPETGAARNIINQQELLGTSNGSISPTVLKYYIIANGTQNRAQRKVRPTTNQIVMGFTQMHPRVSVCPNLRNGKACSTSSCTNNIHRIVKDQKLRSIYQQANTAERRRVCWLHWKENRLGVPNFEPLPQPFGFLLPFRGR